MVKYYVNIKKEGERERESYVYGAQCVLSTKRNFDDNAV